MVIVDTSIWITHFREGSRHLEKLLLDGEESGARSQFLNFSSGSWLLNRPGVNKIFIIKGVSAYNKGKNIE